MIKHSRNQIRFILIINSNKTYTYIVYTLYNTYAIDWFSSLSSFHSIYVSHDTLSIYENIHSFCFGEKDIIKCDVTKGQNEYAL